MKIKKTAIAVVIFLIVLLLAMCNEANAEDGARVVLGKTMVNSSHTYGEFGYEYKSWEVTIGQIGQEDDPAEVFTLSRIVRPDWKLFGATNYYRLGFAYVDDSPLIGDTNFRLGFGLEWELVQLEYFHYSSAGLHDPNTGVDGIQFRVKF